MPDNLKFLKVPPKPKQYTYRKLGTKSPADQRFTISPLNRTKNNVFFCTCCKLRLQEVPRIQFAVCMYVCPWQFQEL